MARGMPVLIVPGWEKSETIGHKILVAVTR
jgi:hypothetical protein